MKATCQAPTNIAFVKYWSNKDDGLRLPENGSLSMCLSNMHTTTTVEFSSDYRADSIEVDGREIDDEGKERALNVLNLIRKMAGSKDYARIVSRNNFPVSTGLSSSASAFAALSVAGAKAAGLNLSEKELSILARQGSGSACRSIPDGFVEWLDGKDTDGSYSVSLYPPYYWNIVDTVAIVSQGRKEVSTTTGHTLADSSPFLETRISHMPQKIEHAKALLSAKNFPEFGELLEAEALELHAIMLTSRPSLIYWTPGTLAIMKLTKKWRAEGISVYFTVNTGQDIHLICEQPSVEAVKAKLNELPEVKDIIVNTPSRGARLMNDHLF